MNANEIPEDGAAISGEWGAGGARSPCPLILLLCRNQSDSHGLRPGPPQEGAQIEVRVAGVAC